MAAAVSAQAADGASEAGRRLVDEALRFVEALRDRQGARSDPDGSDGRDDGEDGDGRDDGDSRDGLGGLDGAAPSAGGDSFGGGPSWAAAFAGEGPAHTGPECRVCPFCRLVATLRTVRPEAVEHLALAVAELANAWREVVAGPRDEPGGAPPRTAEPVVERIDVTD